MDDIMDPKLANKIECFLSRKRAKYQLFDFDKSSLNGYNLDPPKSNKATRLLVR